MTSTSTSTPSLALAISLAIGATSIASGCTALTQTTGPGFARRFGLPERASWYHFMGAAGARDVSAGLCVVAFGLRRDWRGVGTVLVCGTVAGLVDAIITWRHGLGRASWGHLVATVVFGGVGVLLLGGGDEVAAAAAEVLG